MHGTFDQAQDRPQARLKRLPGKARPQGEVLNEFREHNDQRRQKLDRALWPLLAPGPEEFYRWRVQLDCDCVVELTTRGKNALPSDQLWLDPVRRARLPMGQVPCNCDPSTPAPFRVIQTWDEREERTFPADAAECPDWATQETWEVIRHTEAHTSAFWCVTLSCGHVEQVCTDVGWRPSDGPRLTTERRRDEMVAELEQLWRETPDPDERERHNREHYKRMLDQRWPSPFPERECFACTRVHQIVAYQRVGWLVPRPKPCPIESPTKTDLQGQLRRAEAHAARLRGELDKLD